MPEILTCEQCEATFQRREHYLRHLRTHTKERPFQCSVCGHVRCFSTNENSAIIDVEQTFGRIDSLARHHSSTHVDPNTQMVSSKPVDRQRVSRACKRCSTSKIRCDGQLPCEKCTISSSNCYYEEPKKRKSKAQLSSEQSAKRLAQRTGTHAEPGTSDVSEGRQTPAAQAQAVAHASPFGMNPQEKSPAIPTPDQSLPADTNHLLGSNDAMYNSSTFDVVNAPNLLGFQNDFDDLGWMTGNLDPYLWPISFDLGQEFDCFRDTGGVDTSSAQTPANIGGIAHLPTPVSDIADLYSRAHSPALDRDAVEVRQYHATRIELDAPLHFPDIDPASIVETELENFAHVPPLPIEKVQAITQLAEEMQREPHHPPFTNLNIPPQPILNAWVQLYFEYFHPVFPVLHKPTFLLPEVDPLLVLCVAGIGAQFSKLRNARGFAQSLHELVRRRASFQVSTQRFAGNPHK